MDEAVSAFVAAIEQYQSTQRQHRTVMSREPDSLDDAAADVRSTRKALIDDLG